MKRVVTFVLVMIPVLLAPVTAFAQTGSGLNPPQGPSVGGTGGSIGDGGIAFTGAETLQLVVFALALAALGTLLVVVTRRRRAAEVDV